MQKIINNKIIRYVFSGGIVSTSVFLLLFILVNKIHLWYLLASAISFCFGIILSFYLQKFFTFRDKSTEKINSQFVVFVIFNLAMLGINTLLMYLFVDIFGFWYMYSQISITIITAFINYMTFNKIIFKVTTLNN